MNKYRLIWTHKQAIKVLAEFEATDGKAAVERGHQHYQGLPNLILHGTYKVQMLIRSAGLWVNLDTETGEVFNG